MALTDSIAIGAPPWNEAGPDLAFLRLPAPIVAAIERVATIANGDLHCRNLIAGEPLKTRKFCALAGVVDEMTKPAIMRGERLRLSGPLLANGVEQCLVEACCPVSDEVKFIADRLLPVGNAEKSRLDDGKIILVQEEFPQAAAA